MMVQLKVKPELLVWARQRANMEVSRLAERFPKYRQWENGDEQPTLKQLEKLARTVHVPVGCFFLPEPLDETLPLPDFRTMGSATPKQLSPELLDTIYLCQQRQEWYRDFARTEGQSPLAFIGSETLSSEASTVAAKIRNALNFSVQEREKLPNWSAALRRFIESTETLGVLVMLNGVVGSNTQRPLNPDEFRGFALSDELAPLLFVNGADTKAAQIFTLAHELAHLWLGETALSNSRLISEQEHKVETWCNCVAAEILAPLAILRQDCRKNESLPDALNRLSRKFKVSSLVILRRMYDAGEMSRTEFHKEYNAELSRLKKLLQEKRESGGNYYASQAARVGKRFARAVVSSTLEGQTLYRDALHLLSLSKTETFDKFAQELGLS